MSQTLTDHLFTLLAGGQKFSKIDLTQQNKWKFVTVNTHMGIYLSTIWRLPQHQKFQHTMDTILQGLNHVQ